jgi:hypothetical protein
MTMKPFVLASKNPFAHTGIAGQAASMQRHLTHQLDVRDGSAQTPAVSECGFLRGGIRTKVEQFFAHSVSGEAGPATAQP